MNIQVVTLADENRLAHVANQVVGLNRWSPDTRHRCIRLDTGAGVEPSGKLALAAARNTAGDTARNEGAELIIFLDADCIPGPELVEYYRQCLAAHPDAVACGPVTYLDPPDPTGYDLAALPGMTAPHPARPNPAPGQFPAADREEYLLFWSLSFAMTADTWSRLRRQTGGFDERYRGYGGEDTDFALRLREADVPIRWAGGAHAYHQWHPVSSPPWEHLADILVNARRFRDTWGWWPMGGWLKEFARAGAIGPEYFYPGDPEQAYFASEK